MTDSRFSNEMFTTNRLSEAPSGFMLVPVASCELPATAASPTQWIYQQMYERAQRSAEAAKSNSRELFGIMN
jgi:hypothetical protein